MNSRLRKLYSKFDFLYKDIKSVCVGCQDNDCEGYVWLLKEEASSLYDHDVSIAEINNGIFFINSFEKVGGVISVEKPKPPCKLRQCGLCSIYNSRPLVCRIYPIGFETINDEVMVVLHKTCKFSRNLKGEAKMIFTAQVIEILKQTPTNLLNEIIDTYKRVNDISTFPTGPNIFEIISSFSSLVDERR